jgi:hypothetical protein
VNRLAPWMQRLAPAYWIVLPAFVLFFTRLMWPAITHPWSIAVLVLMATVVLVRPRPGRDLVLFVTGATLGIFLEYWGTTRHCWNYWTLQTPPAEAVLAHGFAAVAFARGVQALDRLIEMLPQRWRSPWRRARS